jgi:hypothetical protein
MLTLFAGAAVACSQGVRERTSEQSRAPESPTPSPERATRTPAAAASPTPATSRAVAAFDPIDGDTYPNAKRLAGRFVQALTTYDADAGWREIFNEASRPRDRSFDRAAAAKRARPLFVRGAESRGEIVYPQLGGLSLGGSVDRCSVMVVVRQDLVDDNGDEHTVTRCVDVRLINRDDQWRIEDLADAGGKPVDRPGNLPKIAQTVLDHDDIELPDSARWDIHSGIVDERLLRQMRDIAGLFPYSVCTLRNGHPVNVFGTDKVSGHTAGRAVDIWKVAGEPVVLQQPEEGTDAYRFTGRLLRDGVPELGSPWDLDGPPVPGQLRPSFTDAVHADHIHVAFKAR